MCDHHNAISAAYKAIASIRSLLEENARLQKMIDALNRWDGQLVEGPKLSLSEFPSSFPEELSPGVGLNEPESPAERP